MEYFCFSLVIRIYAVETIRMRKQKKIIEMNTINIKTVKSLQTCLKLVKMTHPKNVKYSENMKIKYVGIFKKRTDKAIIFKVTNLADRVLQIQFYTLLDPLIDVHLPELFFGYRKGKNSHQALAYLSHSINMRGTNRFHLLCININNIFGTISHKYILEHFPFSEKYIQLLVKWLKEIKMYETSNKIITKTKKLSIEVPQSSVIKQVIANVILAKIFENFFNDHMFPKYVKGLALSENKKIRSFFVYRYILGYINYIKLRVANKKEVKYAKNKVKKCLAVAGIRLNQKNIQSYDLSQNVKFDWLGYTFLSFPKKNTRYTKLSNHLNK